MAYMATQSQPSPTSITSFLGLNMNETGDTQLKLGEASKMVNFRITKDYKLEKMHGYKEIYSTGSKIRAQWKGKLGEKQIHVYVAGGKVYNKGVEIGTLLDSITSIFEFNQKLYFKNTSEFKCWDGGTFADVKGYSPLIKTECTPAGEGTDYEPVNMLSAGRRVQFSADGEAKEYYLPEKDVTIYLGDIKIDGNVTDDWQYNKTEGRIIFTNAPAEGLNNIEIQYFKNGFDTSSILKNIYIQKYGLANDTRIFMFGNSDAKNRIVFSDLAEGVPNVEYFPGNNFIDVGSSNTAVTDISRQYDRIIISKENETYFASYEQITDPTGGISINFPTYPLNSSHGMVAPAQGQLLDNYVTTIDSSIVMWVNTNTKDERNAEIISQRIQEWLNQKDLSKAITMDYQELKEYWLAVDNQIMIYNYGNSTFYLLEISENITSLLVSDGIIYLGTESGKIMEFDEEETTYNSQIIDAIWQSGFYDFDVEYKRKTMRILWVALKPWSRTSLLINYISDRDEGTNKKEVKARCASYKYWNYADFTYNTNYSIKPFRIKLKAKKFAYLKLILENRKIDEKVTINSITIQKTYGGNVK